jgi:DNA-binding cell septation regulator SpoVG
MPQGLTKMKIVNLYPNKANGKVKAFFSLEWPEKMVIRDCKLIEGNNGELFAVMPSRQYTDKKTGDQKWTSIVQILDDALLEKISVLARQEYEVKTGTSSSSSDESIPF